MVLPATGGVVLVPFPFSDLTDAKLRPAAVLAHARGADWILCQVTSKPYGDAGAIELTPAQFREGGLRLVSYARPGKLFTANQTLLVAQIGKLAERALNSLVDAMVRLLRGEPGASTPDG